MTSPRILVVDDSTTIRLLLKRTLVSAGYDVTIANDGLQALDIAKSGCPDLAILDIRMPFLDGYGVCQEFKAMGPPWSDVPIVFLTTLNSHALELLGDEMGAYLKKPVCPDDLLQIVRQFVGPAFTESAVTT